MDEQLTHSCADCLLAGCGDPKDGKHPTFCEGAEITEAERRRMIEAYKGDDLKMEQAALEATDLVGREGLCRVEETMAFMRRMGYRKIGIANCGALQREAVIVAKILRNHGWEVFGTSCKFGSIPASEFGCNEESGANPHAMSCNPIEQARRLNEQGTDFNLIIGLCVGHDSLFMKHSSVPCSTLIVKDRALGNNPSAALQNCDVPASVWFRLSKVNESLTAQRLVI